MLGMPVIEQRLGQSMMALMRGGGVLEAWAVKSAGNPVR